MNKAKSVELLFQRFLPFFNLEKKLSINLESIINNLVQEEEAIFVDFDTFLAQNKAPKSKKIS